ncbi:MAG: HRDC domain-containing protein, partial [Salinisphaera sp.]|nr:HRDC domain-containing protein [Salinisphaera sp.]
VIFHDRSLRAMAEHRPASADQLLAIDGVGEKKLEAYGDLFLRAITDCASPPMDQDASSPASMLEPGGPQPQ